ncbi:uncharacterized protein LOC111518558 [Drosophila willistoni]|uniref:uncharacterized protein LOC111518558 n=1 Tax=Drosophila willistoni TaxID=7260 RepID=UPI001F0809ED|nr:uncharacterized protein LOC111518558 [Drosophila willistoni]
MHRRICSTKTVLRILLLIIVLNIIFFGLSRLFISQCQSSSFHRLINLSQFRLEQNGDYWIYHQFIVPLTNKLANETITLTTHGTYLDLGNLEWLLMRWSDPISMAVYVKADNFEATLNRLRDIKYCSGYGYIFDQWVSVQLVFNDKQVPNNLRALINKQEKEFACHLSNQAEESNNNIPPKHEQNDYPMSLLKNVARLNAKTYFVLATELDVLPTMQLAKNFLKLAKLYKPAQPWRTVYCVPIVPYFEPKEPEKRSDLVTLVANYMNQANVFYSLKPEDRDQLKTLRNWLNSSTSDDKIGIYRVSKSSDYCATYISTNSYEPLYDQRLIESPYIDNGFRHQVLTGLNFDFVVLNGTFMTRRRAVWSNESELSSETLTIDKASQKAHILELIKFNSLTLWPRYR